MEKSYGHQNTQVHEYTNRTIKLVLEVRSAATEKQLSYILVAMAMMNVTGTAGRSLKVDSVVYQALKKDFGTGKQYDVGETLAACNSDLDFFTVKESNGDMAIPQREIFDPCSPTQVWHLQAGSGARLLPKIFTHIFKIGAKYVGKIMA